MNLALKDAEPKEIVVEKPVEQAQAFKPAKRDNLKDNHSSNFLFQITLFYCKIYLVFYFVIHIILFIFKLSTLVYPPTAAGIEISSLCLFLLVGLVRCKLGKIGNETETSFYILFYIILTVFTLYSYFYFSFMQTYCLKIEVIMGVKGIIINILEILTAIFSFIVIKKEEASL